MIKMEIGHLYRLNCGAIIKATYLSDSNRLITADLCQGCGVTHWSLYCERGNSYWWVIEGGEWQSQEGKEFPGHVLREITP